jgi:HEPN domain-containing protein
MTLENLVGRSLEIIPKDTAAVERLLEASRRSLADARLSAMSNEGRFDMAYKSIMQGSNAVLQATGYRTLTSKPGHHQLMIQTLPVTMGIDPLRMIVLDGLRKQRNLSDYSGDPVSESMANEALEHAERLFSDIQDWWAVNRFT